MEHDIKKLPKWAQKIISDLEDGLHARDNERKRIEAMIPWTENSQNNILTRKGKKMDRKTS